MFASVDSKISNNCTTLGYCSPYFGMNDFSNDIGFKIASSSIMVHILEILKLTSAFYLRKCFLLLTAEWGGGHNEWLGNVLEK